MDCAAIHNEGSPETSGFGWGLGQSPNVSPTPAFRLPLLKQMR